MPVIVEPYNEDWARQFTQLKLELENILEGIEYMSIEHVGSTSVPGLAAKPVLDIDIVASNDQLPAVLAALQKPPANYLYMREAGIPGRHQLRNPQQLPVRNLYVCIQDSTSLRNHLAIRDLLRKDPILREEYGTFKLALAQSPAYHVFRGLEIHEYISEKTSMILRLLEISGSLTEEELEGIKKANRPGQRLKPIKTKNLVMRELVMDDASVMHSTGLAPTIHRAQEHLVEIVKNAGKVPRTYTEIAVLFLDPIHEGDARLIGRIGARVIDSSFDPQTDELVSGFDSSSLRQDRNVAFLYVLLDPKLHDQQLGDEAMSAFIPAIAKILGHKPASDLLSSHSSEASGTIDWDLAKIWGFRRIDESVDNRGKAVYQVEMDPRS
ncbi:MAG: hypothetical protein M1820_005724 [Bogoriella megaspora]|nr:MAG: hypothetical protein M1820_005724 [Bogoriella megaspora]